MYSFPPLANWLILQRRLQYLAKAPNLEHLNAEITARMIQVRIMYPMHIGTPIN